MIKRSLQIVLFLVAGFLSLTRSESVCGANYPTHDIITLDTAPTPFTQVGLFEILKIILFVQTDCVKSFKVTAGAGDLNKYLIFELEFTSRSTDPLFLPFLLGYEVTSDLPDGMAASNVRATLTLDSGKLTAGSFSDFNGICYMNLRNNLRQDFSM